MLATGRTDHAIAATYDHKIIIAGGSHRGSALNTVEVYDGDKSVQMEEDIRKLQETITHQQEEIQRLSDELYLQQRLISELRDGVRSLRTRVEQMGESGQEAGEEPPPPHY